MGKEALIFGFDGVIVETEDLVLRYLNEGYGINLTRGSYDKGISMEKVVNQETGLNLTPEEFYWDFTRNFTASFERNRDSELFPDAENTLKCLAEKYNLYISTKRNSLGCSVLKFTLKRFGLLGCFTGIHFVYSFDEKKQFIKKPNLDFISSFDSNVSFFINASVPEIEKTKLIVPSILFNPREGEEVKGAWVANNWLELSGLLL